MAVVGRLLGLLPPWAPLALAGVLLAAVTASFFTLCAAWRAEGAARIEIANQTPARASAATSRHSLSNGSATPPTPAWR